MQTPRRTTEALRSRNDPTKDVSSLEPPKYTRQALSGQSRKPRNQAEFRSVYIADLQQVADTNGLNLTDVPPLPIRRPTSRTGRKALQKTFDADCRRLRREAGAPARTGPPIPGSEHNGHRRFYTLEQCRRGARLSAIARRDQALPRWLQIQTLHYRRHSLRTISRQVGMSLSQTHRVVAGRLWKRDGKAERSPYGLVVNSARGTPREWARVLALNEVYRSRCWSADKLQHRLTVRQGAYIEGIVKHRGPDYAAAVVEATDSSGSNGEVRALPGRPGHGRGGSAGESGFGVSACRGCSMSRVHILAA